MREAPPAALEIGFAYDEADEVNAFVRWLHRNVFGHGEQLDATLLGGARDSGARVMLLGDLPWTRRLGYQLGGQLHEERPVVYRSGEEIGREAFSRDTGFVGMHAAVGPEILLQARYEAGRVTTDARRGLGDGRRDTYRMLKGLAAFDHLDDHELPESGLAIVVRGEHSLSGEDVRDYWRVRGDARGAVSRAGFFAEASGTLGIADGDVPQYDLFRIGGPRYLPGHPREELWARQVAGISASLGRDVFGFRVSVEAGGGGAFEHTEDIELSALQWGIGGGIARRTRLGPVILQAGVDEDGVGAVYLTVGRR